MKNFKKIITLAAMALSLAGSFSVAQASGHQRGFARPAVQQGAENQLTGRVHARDETSDTEDVEMYDLAGNAQDEEAQANTETIDTNSIRQRHAEVKRPKLIRRPAHLHAMLFPN